MRAVLTLLLCALALWSAPSWADEPAGPPPAQEEEETSATPVVTATPPAPDVVPSLSRRYRRGRGLARAGVATWVVGDGVFTAGVFFGILGVFEAVGGGDGPNAERANAAVWTAQGLCLVGTTALVVGDRLTWLAARDEGAETSFLPGWIAAGVVAGTWAFSALVLRGEGYVLGPVLFGLVSGTLGSVQLAMTRGAMSRGLSERQARRLPILVPTLVAPLTPGLALAWTGRGA